jgi:hypothetical protein
MRSFAFAWMALAMAASTSVGAPAHEPRDPRFNAPSNPYGSSGSPWRRWRDNRPKPNSEEGRRRLALAEQKRERRRQRNMNLRSR